MLLQICFIASCAFVLGQGFPLRDFHLTPWNNVEDPNQLSAPEVASGYEEEIAEPRLYGETDPYTSDFGYMIILTCFSVFLFGHFLFSLVMEHLSEKIRPELFMC
jgi:hypothetical protein